jgi:hypothetical protein
MILAPILSLARPTAAPAPAFPSAGLLAFWKLADLTDSSGNGNALTNNNDVTFVAGKVGNSAAMADGQYLSRSLTVSVECTVSFWAKLTSSTFTEWGGNYVFEKIGGAGVVLMETGHARLSDGVTFNVDSASAVVSAGGWENWHHFVLTIENDEDDEPTLGKLYVDTVLCVNADGNTMTLTVAAPVIFPSTPGNNYTPASVQIDAAGIWSRVLSAPEIAQLYNNGNGVEP